MTNPLFKVTLALLSLISAVLIGQSLLGADQQSSAIQTDIRTGVVKHQQVVDASDTTAANIAAVRVNLLKQTTGAESAYHVSNANHVSNDSPAQSDSTANRQQLTSSVNRRAFSFHYLDILEWMFAGRNEKAKHQQPQRPSTSLSAR